MACLDGIVTLGLCPDEATPTSGLRLVDAPGISLNNLANAATETYTSGVAMAMSKKSLALTLLRNDFISALQVNDVVAQIANPVYDAGIFNTNGNTGNYAGERGLNVYKNFERGGKLKSLYINSVEMYPLSSGDATLKITDGYKEYSYPITLVANQINSFGTDELSGFPFEVESGSARVVISQASVKFGNTELICHTGCNGSKNECGYVDGWNGTGKVKSNGYGINVKFTCECDYSKILCDLSKSFAGELIWIKWQILIFEEALKSNRLMPWIIYGRDELKEYELPQLKSNYAAKWNALMDGMSGILKTYNDVCLNCKGIRWVHSL